LKKQKYDNYLISINISKDPYLYDDGFEEIPCWMKGKNVHVNFVKNFGPYRKLIPIIDQIDEEALIVTADDDVLYSENWLKEIVETSSLYPSAIVCGMARHIKKNMLGRWQNYANWPLVMGQSLSMELIPIGCAGVAYKKELLDLEFLTDESFLNLAPSADDIWFRQASMRKNAKVYVEPAIGNKNGYIQHSFGLEKKNIYRPNSMGSFYKRLLNRLKAELMNYFGIPLSKNDFAWHAAWNYSQISKQ
jgi:hypothetical protein